MVLVNAFDMVTHPLFIGTASGTPVPEQSVAAYAVVVRVAAADVLGRDSW